MPSLALAILAKKDKPLTTATKKPPRLTIPPDLQSALDLLFLMEEQRTGQVAPSSTWFLAEAFGSQQCRNFRPTPQLQHFLQNLLGPQAYYGAQSLSTYYVVAVMALTLKAVVGNEEIDTILPRCNWCLQYWGIRDNRQGYIEATQSWISRKIKLENGSVNNPNLAVITMERFREIQGHVGRLGKAIESLRKG